MVARTAILPVTDPELDAPDGAIVDGRRRVGMQWLPLPGYEAGTCGYAGCPMTLVRSVGANQKLCWLHAVRLGID